MDKNKIYMNMKGRKRYFGFVIDEEGNIMEFPNCYQLHQDNYNLMVDLLNLKYSNDEASRYYELGDALPLYKLVNEGFICFADLGFEDYTELGILLPKDLKQITSAQLLAILEREELIRNYENHENSYIPKFKDIPRLKETGLIPNYSNNNYNEIFEVIKREKVKKIGGK